MMAHHVRPVAGIGAAIAVLTLMLVQPASAQEPACEAGGEAIMADLSPHRVTVDARFVGADILVFGAAECQGDVIVTVRGPRRQMTVREKTRFAGIWVNGRSVTFVDAPVLYAVASTGPLEKILPPTVRRARSIGIDELYLAADETPGDLEKFRGAMIHYQQQRGLYSEGLPQVHFIGRKLFRASIWFPPSVPTGQYIADVFLVRDNAVIGAHSLALDVYRGGFEARAYDIAHDQPALYGVGAVLAAVLVGWIVGMLFQRP
jgi:uncharacterized protein (TIGR02186 family)